MGRAFKKLVSSLSSMQKGLDVVKDKVEEGIKVLNEINTTNKKIYQSIEAFREDLKRDKGMSSKFGRFAKRRAAWGALKPSKYQEGQVMNPPLLASPGDWTSKDNSITAVQREVTYTERVTYVANKSMDVSKVVLDQLQKLKKLPVPVDADIVLFVSIAMNVATNESVQEVSQAAVKYLAGKVTQMELKVALRNFLEKNPALQLMSRGALQVVQAFWPMIILVIYTKMQTLGSVVDFDDLTLWSPTGCPFSEGCHFLGCISAKYTAEACNCGGRRHCSKGEGLLAKSCLMDSSRCCNVHLSPLPVGNPIMASPNSVSASATCKNSICGSIPHPQGPREECHHDG